MSTTRPFFGWCFMNKQQRGSSLFFTSLNQNVFSEQYYHNKCFCIAVSWPFLPLENPQLFYDCSWTLSADVLDRGFHASPIKLTTSKNAFGPESNNTIRLIHCLSHADVLSCDSAHQILGWLTSYNVGQTDEIYSNSKAQKGLMGLHDSCFQDDKLIVNRIGMVLSFNYELCSQLSLSYWFDAECFLLCETGQDPWFLTIEIR